MKYFVYGLIVGFLISCIWMFYLDRAERILSEKDCPKLYQIDSLGCYYELDTVGSCRVYSHYIGCDNH